LVRGVNHATANPSLRLDPLNSKRRVDIFRISALFVG
jgi:hypothetical protein